MKSHINLDGEIEINFLPALIFDRFECPNYKKCFGFAVLSVECTNPNLKSSQTVGQVGQLAPKLEL